MQRYFDRLYSIKNALGEAPAASRRVELGSLTPIAPEDGGQQSEFETPRRYCSRCVPHTAPKLTAPQGSFASPFVRGIVAFARSGLP